MYRKLFVVTAGTIAAGVGQEITRQMNARPQSDLKVMVRCIDTARLTNRYSMRDGEWFQMTVDPVHMKALYNNRANNPPLNRLLYPELLPKPTGVGGGSIRYNGSGAVLVNRDNLKKWFSANMTGLTRLGDNQTNFSVALIISSVGATGSGSLEYLADVIAEAANQANVPVPIRMDIFILQPGMEGVSQLGLANTLALYAELAATRLGQNDMYDKQYQGRIIMVGWGSTRSLSSIEQLEETVATLVRLIDDPTSSIVAEYQEREVDNHVLLHIDELTELPTHLSAATPVMISLGRLEEQIIQRDAARLINNLVFDPESSGPCGICGADIQVSHPDKVKEEELADEEALVQRASQGNPDALTKLYGYYIDGIYGYIYRRVENIDDAETLIYETFTRAAEILVRGRYTWQGKSFGSWLYSIAKNLLIDHYRKRRPRRLACIPDYELKHEYINILDLLMQQEERDALWQLMVELPVIEKSVIVLRHVYELSYTRIAGRFGRTQDACKQFHYRALKKLKLRAQGTDLRNKITKALLSYHLDKRNKYGGRDFYHFHTCYVHRGGDNRYIVDATRRFSRTLSTTHTVRGSPPRMLNAA